MKLCVGENFRLIWGGRYVYRSRSEGKENVQRGSQTSAVMNDLVCMGDLSHRFGYILLSL